MRILRLSAAVLSLCLLFVTCAAPHPFLLFGERDDPGARIGGFEPKGGSYSPGAPGSEW